MKPKTQKRIIFINDCNCIVDYSLLEKAIIWYQPENTKSKKHIYMHGNYPAISIYKEKIHIHRLIKSYVEQRKLGKKDFVHHKDGNKLNATVETLTIMEASKHQTLHNRGKILKDEHRHKIAEANKKRLGMKIKKRIEMPELIKFLNFIIAIGQL